MPAQNPARRGAVAVLIATVFVDVVGFAMVLPLLPGYAARFGAEPGAIGLLIAVYSAMQFVLAPLWGRLSDRIGRRPVLLMGLVGSIASYLVFAVADGFWLLFLSRMLDGGSGATLNIAQAYLADETTPAQRTRAMGLVGAAYGVGFVIGPILGGITSTISLPLPGYVAAALTTANLLFAWWRLPESVRLHDDTAATAVVPLRWRGLAAPLAVLFAATLAFSVMYVVFPLFGEARFGADRRTVGYWFAFIGLVTAVMQGGLLGRLAARFGEPRVAAAGAALLALGFALVPRADGTAFYVALVALGAGFGMAGPSMLGMISRRAAADRQGRVLGAAQSAASMARIVGPVVAGLVMQAHTADAAFRTSAVIAGVGAVIAMKLKR